jgi:hypothetical protein
VILTSLEIYPKESESGDNWRGKNELGNLGLGNSTHVRFIPNRSFDLVHSKIGAQTRVRLEVDQRLCLSSDQL